MWTEISVKKKSTEGLVSTCSRAKYHYCLYTFFNLYECRLGTEPQIHPAKVSPCLWSLTPTHFRLAEFKNPTIFRVGGNLLKKKKYAFLSHTWKTDVFREMIILKQSCSALWAWLYKEVKRNWEQADYSRKLFIASWFLTNDECITTVRFQKKKKKKQTVAAYKCYAGYKGRSILK